MHLAWYYAVLVVVVALVIGLISAAVADSKEYMGLGFGILGFFASIAVFLITYTVVT